MSHFSVSSSNSVHVLYNTFSETVDSLVHKTWNVALWIQLSRCFCAQRKWPSTATSQLIWTKITLWFWTSQTPTASLSVSRKKSGCCCKWRYWKSLFSNFENSTVIEQSHPKAFVIAFRCDKMVANHLSAWLWFGLTTWSSSPYFNLVSGPTRRCQSNIFTFDMAMAWAPKILYMNFSVKICSPQKSANG